MQRKMTAWKKSRKFGDVYGGRRRPKLADNIFQRFHELDRPGPDDGLPVLIEDNPSRDYFFPITADEAKTAMRALPGRDTEGLTHIWLRRCDGASDDLPLATYIRGSGVGLVTVYPWPRRMKMYWKKRPHSATIREFALCGIEMKRNSKGWFVDPSPAALRKYDVQVLLYKTVGFHNDWYRRRWTKANAQQTAESSEQYVVQKTQTAILVLSRLDSSA